MLERLKKVRKLLALTQLEMAKSLGIKQSTYDCLTEKANELQPWDERLHVLLFAAFERLS